MKTFETEKHNIPEGATHYFNEDHFNYFTWVAVDSFGNCWGLIEKSEVTGGIKPIPQTNTETPEEREALDTMTGISREHLMNMINQQSEIIKELSEKLNASESPNGSEWDGEGLPPVGVECEVRFRTDGDWTDWFSKGKFKAGYDSKVWFSHEFGDCVYPSHDVEFRKPETKQQREDRERLEAAYDLYVTHEGYIDNPVCSISIFTESNEPKNKWLAIVDKTNYRKGVK